MRKVHNANHQLICIIEKDGVIVIEGKGCRTLIKPEISVNYKIETTKK